MEHADFIHLLRLSEQASADNHLAYRRHLALFAALGYAWVITCFVLASALLYWAIASLVNNHFKTAYLWILVAAGSLFVTSLRALWCRLDAPAGEELKQDDAPSLFRAIEQIRKKIKGPPIHHVRLDGSFNASISQLPRYGLFGGAVNHLTIGLPLLLALDRRRFLAVLAHEYGHLRGDHGTFAAWIYRTRLSWMKLEYGLRDDQSAVTVVTQAFLRWYFPRFSAKTFALARQDEYEADAIAGKLLGKDVTGAALTEIDVKGAWIDREFWRSHWSTAARNALPIGPYEALSKLLTLPPPADFARDVLQQSLRRSSDIDDTHPVLRDRLEALGASKSLPAWSSKSALDLLGNKGASWIAHFDKAWCRDNASQWKHHHTYLGRVRERIDALQARVKTNNADEMAELGNLQLRLNPRARTAEYFARAVQLSPRHGPGLKGLVLSFCANQHAERMAGLNQLFEHCLAYRWWACRTAVEYLEQTVTDGRIDTKALVLWRERFNHAREAEDRAWEELTDTDFFKATTRNDLSEFEYGELQSGLSRYKAINRAWLVSKNLKEFSYRRAYILFIELPGMGDEDRYHLCRHLEQSLDLPGPVLVLWAGHSPTLEEIEEQAFTAVYLRS